MAKLKSALNFTNLRNDFVKIIILSTLIFSGVLLNVWNTSDFLIHRMFGHSELQHVNFSPTVQNLGQASMVVRY